MRCGDFFGTSAGCSNLVLCIVYSVLYVFLSRLIGLCCKIDYNLEIEVKIMTFELCFMTRVNFFGRERECHMGMGMKFNNPGNGNGNC